MAQLAVILGICLWVIFTIVVIIQLRHHANLSLPKVVTNPLATDTKQNAGNNTGTTPLAAPANVTATAVSSTQVKLTWSASTGAANYAIYRNNTKIGTTASTT